MEPIELLTCWQHPEFLPQDKNKILIKENNEDYFTKFYTRAEDQLQFSVILRMLYQCLFELHESREDFELKDFCWPEKVLKMRNLRIMIDFLKIIIVNWKVNSENKKTYEDMKNRINLTIRSKKSDSSNVWLESIELAFLLHENLSNEFEIKLEQFLENAKKEYGTFYIHAITPDLRLLLVLMKRNNLNKCLEFLIKKCKFIEFNLTMLTTFKESHDYNNLIQPSGHKFKNKRFHELFLKWSRFPTDIFETLKEFGMEKYLKIYKKMSKDDAQEFRNLLFAREPNYGSLKLSIFEEILRKQGAAEIIRLIWAAFDLRSKGFILCMVRNLIN